MEPANLNPRQFKKLSLDERVTACIWSGIDTGLEVVEKYNIFEIVFEGYVYSSEELILLRLFYFKGAFFACIRYKYPSLEMLDALYVADTFALGIAETEVNLAGLGI